MSITLSALQQQRRDTAANWTSANPTLLAGELGFETDTKKFKIGDGSTAWQSLSYIAGFSISNYPIATADIADDAVTGDKLANDITIAGNLTVNGTTTTVNSTTVTIEDKNIELGSVASPSDSTADNGGITLKGTGDKSITWQNSTGAWTFSEDINLAAGKQYKIQNNVVLNATTLGSNVVASSLTSVGTLTTGTWSASTIAVDKGGTGQTSYTDGQLLIGNSTGNTLDKATLTAGTGVTITNGGGAITIAATGAAASGFGDGSSSAPSIFFTSDTDTGLFRPTANQLGISTSGSERLRIDGDGRFLLGTNTAPSGGDAHSANARLVVHGRIGNAADSGRINLKRGSSASNGSSIGSITFTDSSNNAFARIETLCDATPGTNDYPGSIVFSTTADGAASPSERLRVTNAGYLGLGTTTPPRALTNANAVTLTTGTAPQYRLNATAADDDDNDRAIFGLATASGHFVSSSTAGDAVLRTTDGNDIIFGEGTTERFRITAAGQIGLGGANYGSAGEVITSAGNGAVTWSAAGGGLTGFTGSANTSSPNDTDNVSAITVNSTSTDGYFAIIPKGTGGIIADIPDSTTTGGNIRGDESIDLMLGSRGSAADVAGGTQSGLFAGQQNSISTSGTGSVILGGEYNDMTNSVRWSGMFGRAGGMTHATDYGLISGSGNDIGGGSSVNVGGSSCDVSADYAGSIAGNSHDLNADYSVMLGGAYTRSNTAGAVVMGAGGSVSGTTQWGTHQQLFLTLGRKTTDATDTVLGTSSSTPSSTNQLEVPSNSAVYFTGTVVATMASGGDTAAWSMKGLAKRGSAASTTTLIGSAVTSEYADSGASSWAVAVAADTSSGCVKVTVTGEASHTIRWGATFHAHQVGQSGL